jgi:GNAT superfamily N-acetyltransferase
MNVKFNKFWRIYVSLTSPRVLLIFENGAEANGASGAKLSEETVSEIEYRDAEPRDIPELKRLMNAQYARKKEDAYFRWQYFEGAFPTVVKCAFEEGRLVGMFGLQRRLLSSGAVAAQAIDLLVDPAMRGKGVFRKLGDLAFAKWKDVDLFCVLPNFNGMRASERSLKWKTIAKIDTMLVEPDEAISRADDPFEDGDDAALERFAFDDEIFARRFDAHPDYDYERIDAVGGVAYLKTFVAPEDGAKFGDVVYYRGADDTARATREILLAACRRFAELGVSPITAWAPPHSAVFRAARSLGFEPKPAERYFCVKVVNPDLARLEQFERWRLQMADAELF